MICLANLDCTLSKESLYLKKLVKKLLWFSYDWIRVTCNHMFFVINISTGLF